MYDYLSQDAGTEFQALMDLLRAGDFQIRADYESGMLYLTSSSFPSLLSLIHIFNKLEVHKTESCYWQGSRICRRSNYF